MHTFVFTCGDINGIGPEIIIKTINRIKDSDSRFIIIIPENSFNDTIQLIKPEFDYTIQKGRKLKWDKQVIVYALKKTHLDSGKPTKFSGESSFAAIKKSFQLLKQKKADAVITAPISKLSLSMAGIKYPGHTEMFAEWCGIKNHVMMFLSDDIKCALNSIHIPLKKVPAAVNQKNVKKKLDTIINSLKVDFHIIHPRIAVLGLNPHAGEEGILGKEEIKILKPLIDKLPEADGPFSPDAFFAKKLYRNYDVVFGMYHDQVLIPFKLLNFNLGVNYTAGLPIIRTSPDHGTAYDIAGKGIADESSMFEAYRYAEILVRNRNN